MCGRTVFQYFKSILNQQFSIEVENTIPKSSFNVAPGNQVPVIYDDEGTTLDTFKWGLIPHWAKDEKIGYKMINARSESIAEKPAYRNAFKKQRCIIPMTGFYEWQKTKKAKIPHYFHLENKEYLAMAGLYETWKKDDVEIKSCTIITGAANKFMEKIHDRMPILLTKEDYSDWMDPENQSSNELMKLLKPGKVDLTEHMVTPYVNNPRNKEELCIKPVKTLF
jgi:putative SOS response-associated peptidase YedK